MKKQLIAFENFECLFPEEEACLEHIIQSLQTENDKYYFFDEKELVSLGLHIEHIYSLFNKHYIEGQLFDNNSRGFASLTAKGLDYLEHKKIYMDLKKKEKIKQNLKQWIPYAITTFISIIALIRSIIND